LWLRLKDDGPVQREVQNAYEQLGRLALEILDGESSQSAHFLRKEFSALLTRDGEGHAVYAQRDELRSRVIVEQRRVLVELRAQGEIGDEAFHEVEARLDLEELSASSRE
jgi:CPA1 family monovalent cation:H+ antiporter